MKKNKQKGKVSMSHSCTTYMLYVLIPLIVRCRTLPVHITYTTPTRSLFYAYKQSRNLERKHSCSSGHSSSTGQVSITINQQNIVDCYKANAYRVWGRNTQQMLLRSRNKNSCSTETLITAARHQNKNTFKLVKKRRGQ